MLKKHAAFGEKIVHGVVSITHTEQQVSKNIEEDGPILKPYTHTFMLLHPCLLSFLSSKTTKYFVNFWWENFSIILVFFFFLQKVSVESYRSNHLNSQPTWYKNIICTSHNSSFPTLGYRS